MGEEKDMKTGFKRLEKCVLAAVLSIGFIFTAGCGNNVSEKQENVSEAVTSTEAEKSAVATAGDMTDIDTVGYEGMEAVSAADLNDGTYEISVDSSSSMFKITGCTLTVNGDSMDAVIRMGGTGYLYICGGTAEEAAEKNESDYIPFTEEADGSHSFEIKNLEALDKALPFAAFSRKKEMWYDRSLCFRADSLPNEAFKESRLKSAEELSISDGTYTVDVKLEGGSGKANVTSPAKIKVEAGKVTATIEWSSSNYDYMVVDGEKYLPVNTDGNSVFEIPVSGFDGWISVKADTTAMSKPHEIDYKLYFDSGNIAGDKTASSITDWTKASLSSSLSLLYAKQFTVDMYRQGNSAPYSLITVKDDGKFLVVPHGCKAPKNVDKDIKVINEGTGNYYVANSAAMDFFISIDALHMVSFTSTEKNDWGILDVAKAMEEGGLSFVGKYNSPDFEALLSKGVTFAIENTMIYHKPEIKEQLERLGITVLVDHASYEESPLGRLEWVKLYGVISGKNKEAEMYFDSEIERISHIVEKADNTGSGDTGVESGKSGNDNPGAVNEGTSESDTKKKVAYFYISPKGYAVVRKSGDYVPKMIEMAGGSYVPASIKNEDEDALSTMHMDLETFYASVKDADVIIYDTTINGDVKSVQELVTAYPILQDMKAVKSGNVWITGQDMYQFSAHVADAIEDINAAINGRKDGLNMMEYLEP